MDTETQCVIILSAVTAELKDKKTVGFKLSIICCINVIPLLVLFNIFIKYLHLCNNLKLNLHNSVMF